MDFEIQFLKRRFLSKTYNLTVQAKGLIPEWSFMCLDGKRKFKQNRTKTKTKFQNYLFKRERREKDFPHLAHLCPSSFSASFPSSFTSGGGEISSSSSPWVWWWTAAPFLPSKNVASPLKAMACSRSLIAASCKKDQLVFFLNEPWGLDPTWTSAHLSEECDTRCWSSVDFRENVLLQCRHVSFGRTLRIERTIIKENKNKYL